MSFSNTVLWFPQKIIKAFSWLWGQQREQNIFNDLKMNYETILILLSLFCFLSLHYESFSQGRDRASDSIFYFKD